MRRVSPSSLQKHQSFRQLGLARLAVPPVSSRFPSNPSRYFASSSSVAYPRSGPYPRFQSSSAVPAEEDEVDERAYEHELEDPAAPGAGDDASVPPRDSFEELVVSVTHPQPTGEPIPEYLRSLHNHMLTAFLPANQHLEPVPQPSRAPNFPLGGPLQPLPFGLPESQESVQTPETILALVSPFEGGRHYVADAVRKVASEMDAEVLRFDLALGLGLHGSASPLGQAGSSAPVLPKSTNPLLQESPRPLPLAPSFPSSMQPPEEEMEEQDEEGEPRSSNAIIVSPYVGRFGMGGPSGPNEAPSNTAVKEDWVSFFEHWINKDGGELRNRVILLESTEAMSSTFDEWWPSFVEAVRRRRRDGAKQSTGGRKSKSAKIADLSLNQPTVIILSSSPSLLLPHTASPITPAKDGIESAVGSIHPMLQEIADKFGGTVETKVENSEAGPLWWGSEETDIVGRLERDGRRLSALLDQSKGASSLLPAFGSRGGNRGHSRGPPGRHGLLDMLMGQTGRQTSQDDANRVDPLLWKTLAIVPPERNKAKEMLERITTRSLISSALLNKALTDLGGELVDPTAAATFLEVEVANSKKQHDSPLILRLTADSEGAQISKLLAGRPFKISGRGWQNAVRPWRHILDLAATTIGQKLSDSKQNELVPMSVQVSWRDVLNATRTEKDAAESTRKRIKQFLPRKPLSSKTQRQSDTTPTEPVVDAVVNRVKKAKDLSSHEKRLLGCIVDTTKLASTTFDDVHLPFKTIDAIRTIISLPLLFPEAFKGGVLRDHSTTGALLFGPPGTGKTLLARAVANESGARMLAIQPSDVNDKYFGEGEKLVKAVFSLARRLSPCVVFLDEVDALFGARSSRGAGFGNKAHDQLLTEFMQEMDGLSSSEINKDMRIVVVGATNRPFDLDDAVLRRLPRRLLVDLPGPEDRKAILKILLRGETLGDDVIVDNIVQETDGFSGSDLKHLCVSAALAAVKDSVRVPWSRQASVESAEIVQPAAETSSSAGRCENLVLESDQAATKPELITEPTASLAPIDGVQSQVVVSDASPKSQEEGKGDIRNDDAGVEQTTKPGSSNETSGHATSAEEEVSTESGEKSVIQAAPRILSKKHFTIALAEIRPSSSEEGSLPELRKWAEQFGEGGSQRGRKKGFGKGFGFGDPASKSNRDRGYGKVAEDD